MQYCNTESVDFKAGHLDRATSMLFATSHVDRVHCHSTVLVSIDVCIFVVVLGTLLGLLCVASWHRSSGACSPHMWFRLFSCLYGFYMT